MATRSDISKAVFAHLEREQPVPGETQEEQRSCRYLDMRLIGSIDYVLMISDLERRFGIEFSPDELSNGALETVGGIIAVVEKLTEGPGERS